MSYDYVRRTYGVDPQVGQRVRHSELRANNEGKVAPMDESCAHYVMVKFDGRDEPAPCHPTALEYL